MEKFTAVTLENALASIRRAIGAPELHGLRLVEWWTGLSREEATKLAADIPSPLPDTLRSYHAIQQLAELAARAAAPKRGEEWVASLGVDQKGALPQREWGIPLLNLGIAWYRTGNSKDAMRRFALSAFCDPGCALVARHAVAEEDVPSLQAAVRSLPISAAYGDASPEVVASLMGPSADFDTICSLSYAPPTTPEDVSLYLAVEICQTLDQHLRRTQSGETVDAESVLRLLGDIELLSSSAWVNRRALHLVASVAAATILSDDPEAATLVQAAQAISDTSKGNAPTPEILLDLLDRSYSVQRIYFEFAFLPMAGLAEVQETRGIKRLALAAVSSLILLTGPVSGTTAFAAPGASTYSTKLGDPVPAGSNEDWLRQQSLIPPGPLPSPGGPEAQSASESLTVQPPPLYSVSAKAQKPEHFQFSPAEVQLLLADMELLEKEMKALKPGDPSVTLDIIQGYLKNHQDTVVKTASLLAARATLFLDGLGTPNSELSLDQQLSEIVAKLKAGRVETALKELRLFRPKVITTPDYRGISAWSQLNGDVLAVVDYLDAVARFWLGDRQHASDSLIRAAQELAELTGDNLADYRSTVLAERMVALSVYTGTDMDRLSGLDPALGTRHLQFLVQVAYAYRVTHGAFQPAEQVLKAIERVRSLVP